MKQEKEVSVSRKIGSREPHHLKKYPNKLDYSIKMKEYFDHYLKGLPAPKWIEKGISYRGK